MHAELLTILIAIAVVSIGLALLISHALVRQLLAVLGTVLAGVVLVFHLLT